ncbi:hypothetical protein PInf_028087 [Phytophthora infestans]|nr:hypothetical protein PInf_028087 [Phytophthora infestans]
MRWIRIWLVSALFVDVPAALVQVDRQVYAELQRVAPGNPVSAYALVFWSAFDNALEASGGTASVEAYEVQYAVSGSGVWQSLGDSLTGFRVDLGAQATEHVPKQRIFTRADDGESINDGYFRLGLSYEGSSPSILGGRATAGVVTPPIAFDASADAMKTAIESLEQVTQVQVERNALDADGAFEWIILFDLVAYDGEDPLPLLSLYTETVSAQWTGDGDQVAVQYLRMAPSSPGRHRRICSDECSYQVTGLQTGRAFSFRVRAQYSYAIGWSSWSASSEPLEIPATPVPRAPSTPELLAATTSHVTISWRMRRELTQENGIFAREFFPVTSFQAQQQCDSEIGWTTISERIPPGFSGNSDTFVTVVASLERPPGSTCEFRVAATNANGQGPFSLPSAKFTTLQTAPGAVANLRVARDPLTVVWNTPEVLGGHALEELTYDVEYRTTLGSTWTRLPAELVDCSSRLANISMTSLKGYTTYVTRVRAVAERQAGSFSQSAEFLTDYTVEDDSNSDNVKDLTLGTRQVVIAAARQQCANTQDWYYVQLTGNGGSGGSTSGDEAKPGEHGAVLVFPVTPIEFQLTSLLLILRIELLLLMSTPGALGELAFKTVGVGSTAVETAAQAISQAAGGGASEVRVNGRTAVVAAGGGGAGSTDYCCAHGGGGGGLDEAESGLAPDATTIPLDSRVTGQAARDEYHSSNVPGDTRDFEGLSARHGHLDWGFAASSADYSVLATGGTGATPTTAGVAGTAGSYRYSLEGTCLLNPQTSLVDVAVSPLTASHWPSNGRNGSGGSGQSGKQAGGGGGGGFFGGGGGGAGVDGAGGGGGSSFVSFRDLFNSSKSGISDASLRARVSDETVDKLRVTPLTSSSVKVSWKAPRFGFSQLVEGFVIEMANRSVNEDFRLVRLVTLYTPSVALGVAPTARWTQLASLADRESPSIAERRVHAGRTTLLTPFELMAVGRGLKSPRRASLGSRTAMAASRFESQLDVRLKRLEDLIDGWRAVATASGEDESALDEQRPVPRYWAASAFVSSLPGSKVPRVFLFGGQDDTTLLDDFWSLNWLS